MNKKSETSKYGVICVSPSCDVKLVGLDDYKLTLEQLYEYSVCDCIQIVRCATNDGMALVIDDNGKVLGKEINLVGTVLYGAYPNDVIVGDVMIGTLNSPNPYDEPDVYAFPYEEAIKVYSSIIKLIRQP